MDSIWKTDFVIAQTACLARSLKHWTDRELLPGISDPLELAHAVFEAPFAVASHGTQADPVLNFGNRAALALWEMSCLAQTACRARSLKHGTDRDLLPGISDPLELANAVFEAPFAVASHGTQADPVLNFGNRAALALWE